MAGLKQIKTKIRSVEKTQTVTKAMEAVSAAKMRKAQIAALSGRAYARAAVSILARVSGSASLKNNLLTRGVGELFSEASSTGKAAENNSSTRGNDATEANISAPFRALYIVITSDKGLAGGLNSAVLRKVQNDITNNGLKVENTSIIAIGKKANDYFASRGYSIEAFHTNTENLTHETLQNVVEEAAHRFASGAIDRVSIAYQQFVSTFEQRPALRVIFPLSITELNQVVKDIIPAKGAYSDITTNDVQPLLYTVEPSEEAVLNALLPKLASIFVLYALLESHASEHSARMVAMKSASDKAEEMEHSLTLQFNKARQAAITREVSEITGGMEAMTT